MNIEDWTIDMIMQLPECCFGSKWWIGRWLGTQAHAPIYFVIDDKLPDLFVVWDVMVSSNYDSDCIRNDLSLRLVDRMPTSETLRSRPALLEGLGLADVFYELKMPAFGLSHLGPLRQLVVGKNLRIGGAFKMTGAKKSLEGMVGILISSIPKEVPDWLISGPGSSP